MCGICNAADVRQLKLFSEEEMDNVVDGVFAGYWTKHNLPPDVYKKTAKKFMDGVIKGYKEEVLTVEFGTKDIEFLKDLRENVYFFSAAKTYQQVKDINDALFDEEGNRKLLSAFKKEANVIFKTYNENYLTVEYYDAIAQSRMAKKWQEIKEDAEELPLLMYQTAHDSRVRPTHAALEGITRPINDPFWKMYYPPNGWHCRCTVIQLHAGEVTDMKGFKQPNDVPDDFLMNSGINKVVFPKSHPYFKVTGDDRDFARKNFGLPIPQEDEKI